MGKKIVRQLPWQQGNSAPEAHPSDAPQPFVGSAPALPTSESTYPAEAREPAPTSPAPVAAPRDFVRRTPPPPPDVDVASRVPIPPEMQAQPSPAPRRKSRRRRGAARSGRGGLIAFASVAAAVVVVLVIALTIRNAALGSRTSTSSSASSTKASSDTYAATTPKKPIGERLQAGIVNTDGSLAAGDYVVGKDVVAGIYMVTPNAVLQNDDSSSYFSIDVKVYAGITSTDASYNLGTSYYASNSDRSKHGYLNLTDGNVVHVSVTAGSSKQQKSDSPGVSLETIADAKAAATPATTISTDGFFAVGIDLAPGTYDVTLSSQSYAFAQQVSTLGSASKREYISKQVDKYAASYAAAGSEPYVLTLEDGEYVDCYSCTLTLRQ